MEPRRTYDAIVAQIKDPALLEFAGWNLIRSSVFPVPVHGTQRVRVAYDHVLTAERGRIDYVLPRSKSLTVEVRGASGSTSARARRFRSAIRPA